VAELLPPELQVKVVCRPLDLTDTSLSKADAAVFVLERNGTPDTQLSRLPGAPLWRDLRRNALKAGGEEAPILVARLANARHTLVVVGFLKPDASGFARLDLAGRLMREALRPGVATLQVHAPGFAEDRQVEVLEAVLSAALAGAAPMPQMKSKAIAAPALARVEISTVANAVFERSTAIAAGNHLARWLTALPPNVLDTPGYRNALQTIARREGWSFRFYGAAALEKLNAGAFLAVARANAHRGAGIARLTYEPQEKKTRARSRTAKLALVGKGICFDTGGINLKAHRGMYMMHGDMQGSAVALGTLLALSRLGVATRIDCWLAITENEIGPVAYRPQEVVTASNGVTIQVVHSDAEGRMVLADTLALASREKPALLLDFATLTGACVNAVTDRYSGAFTNRARLQEWLQGVGRSSGERVWCFPMDEDFDKALESNIADVLQCSPESKGDHILAARFLSKFVEKSVPWVHLDLAAAEHKGGLAHVPTEFTGFGVRFSVHLLGDLAALSERLQALA
jgi:leucyl aminopeptidase